jgi:hypothetical protein
MGKCSKKSEASSRAQGQMVRCTHSYDSALKQLFGETLQLDSPAKFIPDFAKRPQWGCVEPVGSRQQWRRCSPHTEKGWSLTSTHSFSSSSVMME